MPDQRRDGLPSPSKKGPLALKSADHAVDESDDVDSDFASNQKILSQKRRAAKDSPEARLQKALPCAFRPNIRPLTISDLESVVALENAAFPQPEHRASREKACERRHPESSPLMSY